MLFLGKEYIKATKNLRQLAILEALADNGQLSQTKLGTYSHTSGAMVHRYLNEMQDVGLLDFLPVTRKSFNYHLTTQGRLQRLQHMESYCTEMVQAYASLKDLVRSKLAPYAEQNITNLVLFGAAETCEVVVAALQDSPFSVVGIVDNNTSKHGNILHGHTIQPADAVSSIEADAIVITSFAQQEAIHKQLLALGMELRREIIRL